MEARGGGIGVVDHLLRHTVAGEIVEADILEGVAELRGGPCCRTRLAGEIVRNIDQRNLATDHGGRHEGGSGWVNGWLHGLGLGCLAWIHILATNTPTATLLP